MTNGMALKQNSCSNTGTKAHRNDPKTKAAYVKMQLIYASKMENHFSCLKGIKNYGQLHLLGLLPLLLLLWLLSLLIVSERGRRKIGLFKITFIILLHILYCAWNSEREWEWYWVSVQPDAYKPCTPNLKCTGISPLLSLRLLFIFSISHCTCNAYAN